MAQPVRGATHNILENRPTKREKLGCVSPNPLPAAYLWFLYFQAEECWAGSLGAETPRHTGGENTKASACTEHTWAPGEAGASHGVCSPSIPEPQLSTQQSYKDGSNISSHCGAEGKSFWICSLLCPFSLGAILIPARQVPWTLHGVLDVLCIPAPHASTWRGEGRRGRAPAGPAITALAPHSVPGAVLLSALDVHPAAHVCVRKGRGHKRAIPRVFLCNAAQGHLFFGRGPALLFWS